MIDICEYYDMLEAHDWFHEFSDEHRIYCAGRDIRQRLEVFAKQSDEHMTFFNNFKAHNFSGPAFNTTKVPKLARPKPKVQLNLFNTEE